MKRRALFLSFFVSLLIALSATSCHRKDRLSDSSPAFLVSPTTQTLLRGQDVTLTARIVSRGQSLDITPTWTVSGTAGTLDRTIGSQVTFTATHFGDAVITATYDGARATTQIAVVSFIPSSSDFNVYTDNGLPPATLGAQSDIFTSLSASQIQEVSSGYTTEGVKYMRLSHLVTNDFWLVTVDKNTTGNNLNLSAYATLKFSLRLGRALSVGEILRIEIQDTTGTRTFNLVTGSNGFNRLNTDWQEISIPLASFGLLNTSAVKVPFAIVVAVASSPIPTLDLDGIRWTS